MKQALFIALLASTLSAPFAAQAQNVYVGGSVGAVKVKVNSDRQKSSDNDTGFKLYGGYQINPNFGVEAGVAALGKTDVRYNGVNGGKTKPSAAYVAGTATMPLSEQFSVFGKVGVSANRNTFDQPGGSPRLKYNNTAAMLGVGATFHFTPALALVAEYEHFGKVQDTNRTTVKAQMLSAGLRYKF